MHQLLPTTTSMDAIADDRPDRAQAQSGQLCAAMNIAELDLHAAPIGGSSAHSSDAPGCAASLDVIGPSRSQVSVMVTEMDKLLKGSGTGGLTRAVHLSSGSTS